ncbi:MAG: Maf-like protein [Bacteroides sp.]|nr:Maf-like protein [Bacteroides sp.]
MLSNLNKYKLILASNSPRRQELMKGLGVAFEVRTLPDLDESYPPILKGEKIPLYIAREKAAAYLPSMQADELIITADTIVWKDGEVLGKPADKAEAKEMLHKLSGGCHQVVTGVCLTTQEWQRGFTSVTDVKFAPLTEEVIDYYVENFSPLDKAGAYGIQEWIGYAGVESISGSYFNVMGLPIHKLYKELVKL